MSLLDQSPVRLRTGAVREKCPDSHSRVTGPALDPARWMLNRPGGQSQCICQKAAFELDEDHFTWQATVSDSPLSGTP